MASEGHRAQKHDRVRKQAHRPGELQAVEEKGAESELIFFVGLRWLNPWSDLAEQMLCKPRSVRHQAEEDLVARGGKGKFAGAAARLPATRTELAWAVCS